MMGSQRIHADLNKCGRSHRTSFAFSDARLVHAQVSADDGSWTFIEGLRSTSDDDGAMRQSDPFY